MELKGDDIEMSVMSNMAVQAHYVDFIIVETVTQYLLGMTWRLKGYTEASI